ncbi:MAG TPA: DUF427 domain-containing protein [Gammaproteobacteria bacterium]|nr:DUF427 domain-containing protein [Gammaproteobacteria bacterium]
MTCAIWRETVLADSDKCVIVEGNYYFPPDSVNFDYLEPSETRTECGWKGTAHYYHVVTERARNADAAWTYPSPKDAAQRITDHVAFWKGVEIRGLD